MELEFTKRRLVEHAAVCGARTSDPWLALTTFEARTPEVVVVDEWGALGFGAGLRPRPTR
jgi:hypothetical protein